MRIVITFALVYSHCRLGHAQSISRETRLVAFVQLQRIVLGISDRIRQHARISACRRRCVKQLAKSLLQHFRRILDILHYTCNFVKVDLFRGN